MRRIAVAQMCSVAEEEANYKLCSWLVDRAKSLGAGFLSLPECFAFLGVPGAGQTFANSREIPHSSLFQKYANLAKSAGIWLSLGGMHERIRKTTLPDKKLSESVTAATAGCAEFEERVYNTHAIVDDKGVLVAKYRKLHLFDVDVDGGFKESNRIKPGSEMLLVKNTPFGNLGVTTCYDMRFPELYSVLRDHGADVLLAPSAFMPTTGKAHWEVLLRARAIETQCYVAAAAQCGKHNSKRSSYGHALIVDPWGRVLADAGATIDGRGRGKPKVVTADLDLEAMAAVRARMPITAHRRKDVCAVSTGRLRVVDYKHGPSSASLGHDDLRLTNALRIS